MSGLKVQVAGLKLRNPVMNASGVLGLTASSLKRVAQSGVGAVVTKSLGLEARLGNPNPAVVEVNCGLLNSMGLPNPGVEEAIPELRRAVREVGVPVIVSIYGFNPEEFEEIAKRLDKIRFSALELNVSCPHVGGAGLEVGQREEVVAEVVRRVKSASGKPLFLKLSPNLPDVADMAKTAQEAGADAITAVNTVRAMAIDVETGTPILGGRVGGLSGPAVKPIAVRCVYEVFEAVRIPVIGCGGVSNWQDAVEFMMAGASALQVGTAVKYRGLPVFAEILDGLNRYMKRKKLRSVTELVGLAHKR